MTAEFLSLIDEKHHWSNICKRRPNQYNKAHKREAIQRVNRESTCTKRGYITERLSVCKGNSKRTWKILKELWPSKSKKTEIKQIDNLTENKDMANALNEHFIKVVPKHSEKFDNS